MKLNLDDLLNPLGSSSSNLISLKKSTKILTSTSTKNQTLAAPLPTRTQERLDREAAYEQTKDEVDKWSATMKHIKEVFKHFNNTIIAIKVTIDVFVSRLSTSVSLYKPSRRDALQISSSLRSLRYRCSSVIDRNHFIFTLYDSLLQSSRVLSINCSSLPRCETRILHRLSRSR